MVQVLATFKQENLIDGVETYNLNYAVNENNRGAGLANEAIKIGLTELKKHMKSFYIEAIVEKENIASIKVAKKIFPNPGVEMTDEFSGMPSLFFFTLIQ